MSKVPAEKTYNKFWFEKWAYRLNGEGKLLIDLHYSLDKKVFFQETLGLPVDWKVIPPELVKALDKAVAALHIIGGISYYKTYLPGEMAGLELDSEQASFWKKVYERGLGEFFYRNKLDFRGLINFPVSRLAEGPKPARTALNESALVPIGGGKDSIVTAEILKKAGVDMTLISLRNAAPIANTAHVLEIPRIVVERQLDSLLFKLNEEGAYNGHVPITGYISFLLLICSIVYGHKYLVMSLEKSANSGQLIFHGMDINHQYSKSEEFEADFREYVKKYIHSGVQFFSLLRGYNELKIAEMFAGLPNLDRYAGVFTSCNGNFKIHKSGSTTLWCCDCPKCLFVFIILAPFIDKATLMLIFGSNLLERHDLLPLLQELLGVKNFKPFECVGTSEESQLAMWMISQKEEYEDSMLVKFFREKILPKLGKKDWKKERQKILAGQQAPFIPAKFRQLLKKYE